MKNFCVLRTFSLILMIIISFFVPLSLVRAEIVARYGDAFLENVEGRQVLHLKGSQYEMGYQYGKLMSEELAAVMKDIEEYAMGFGVPWWLIEPAKRIVSSAYMLYFPQEDQDFLWGIYWGADKPFEVSFSNLVFMNSLIDVGGLVGEIFDTKYMNCSSFAAWGSLTEGGKCFQTRNVDLTTGTGLENHAVVVYHKPDGKYPYANPGWVGLIGCASGLSSKGIGIGQIWGTTMDHFIGTPWCLKTRRILMECNSAEMAANYMNDLPYRTYGSNFVFGDGDNLQGRAVETTWHYSASFRDNDPEELKALYQGECYAIMMEDAVFRSDPAMDPQIRSVQTAANGPDGDPRTAGSYKNRYQGQADSIMVFKNAGIPIGHEEAEYISKSVAMEGSSLQVCVYANTDKELWVANSEITPGGDVIDACDGIYYYYDFSRFLPTVDISTNQGQYRVGDRMEVTLQLSNLGRASREDIFVYLEHNGNRYYLPDKTKDPKPLIKGKLFETGIQEQIVVFNETIPLFFPRGVSVWHVEAYEAGTGDLIDLGSEDILVKLLDEHSSLR